MFINLGNNAGLDGQGFTPFGEVVEGMDVVNKIRVVDTGVARGMQDVPVEPIEITKVTVD